MLERQPLIKETNTIRSGQKNLEWPTISDDKLGPEWKHHVVPVAELKKNPDWEQVAPIPVFHRTESSFNGKNPIAEYLSYFSSSTDNGIQVRGETLPEAEDNMRDHLPFTIKLGEGKLGFPPIPPLKEQAIGASQYIKRKS